MLLLNRAKNRLLAPNSIEFNRVFDQTPGSRFRTGRWSFPLNRVSIEHLEKNLPIFSEDPECVLICKTVTDYDPTSFKRSLPPIKFKTEPMSVQAKCYEELWGLPHFALSCEVGLGKAKMILDLAYLMKQDQGIGGMLVVMPPGIVYNFKREVEKHMTGDYDVEVLEYNNKRGISSYDRLCRSTNFKILICAISKLWLIKGEKTKNPDRGKGMDYCTTFLQICGKSMLALDESHSIKNPDKSSFKNMYFLAQFATHRLIATGTQTSRKTADLYGQYAFLSDQIVGVNSWQEYRNSFCVFGGFKNKQVIGFKNEDWLLESIRPWTFVAQRKDWLDLPELIVNREFVDMKPEQSKVIDRIIAERAEILGQSNLNDYQRDRALVEATNAIQRIAGGYDLETQINEKDEEIKVPVLVFKSFLHVPKVERLLSLIDQIEGKILLFVHFEIEQIELVNMLRTEGHEVLFMKSGLSSSHKEDMLEKFRTDPKQKILLGHQLAMGVGVTVNEARTTIFYSSPRDPISRTQAQGRNHRIGQTSGVLHLDLLSRKSYDAKILDSLEEGADFDAALKQTITTGVDFIS